MLTDDVYTGALVWGVKGKYHRESGLEPIRVEGAFPALVGQDTFDRLRETLKSRAPNVVSPARAGSQYLLSGILRCGSCQAAMFGAGAKSGRYHYYVCATAHRNGKRACGMKPVPQATIEAQVLQKVRELVLQEEHLKELVRLTNEELRASMATDEERVRGLQSQLADMDRRLERLYDALETAKIGIEDLAPRIREHRQKRDLLLRTITEAKEALDSDGAAVVSQEDVLGYLNDIRGVLNLGSHAERRSLLRSFVKTVERHDAEAVIRYTVPLPPEQIPDVKRVLDLVPFGGPKCTELRTFRWEVSI